MADFQTNANPMNRQGATAVATEENVNLENNIVENQSESQSESQSANQTATEPENLTQASTTLQQPVPNQTPDKSPEIADSGETAELDEESVRLLQSKIETQLLKYFQNKEIAKERSEENKLLLEELEELFEELGDDEIVIPLPSGENAVLTSTIREREVLDVDMLADEMHVPKDELKTPFDFCAFTAKGQLTPSMITKHTSVEREVKMRISKRKASTKRRKKSK